MGERAAVALLALLALTLPFSGKPVPGGVGMLMLVAAAVGTVVAVRHAVRGSRLVRVLHRATLAALVASALLVVLVAVTGQSAG